MGNMTLTSVNDRAGGGNKKPSKGSCVDIFLTEEGVLVLPESGGVRPLDPYCAC